MRKAMQTLRPCRASRRGRAGVGDMLARGARHSIATPLVNAAYANLSVYQKQIAKR